jgi:hypothetical protein
MPKDTLLVYIKKVKEEEEGGKGLISIEILILRLCCYIYILFTIIKKGLKKLLYKYSVFGLVCRYNIRY